MELLSLISLKKLFLRFLDANHTIANLANWWTLVCIQAHRRFILITGNALSEGIKLSGFTCASSLTMNEKFQYRKRPLIAVLKFSSSLLVNELQANPDNSRAMSALTFLLFKLAVPKFSRKLSINWHHHMKDHVEIGHLTKYDAFRMNRDQVMDQEIWFEIHTNVSNFETASPLKPY